MKIINIAFSNKKPNQTLPSFFVLFLVLLQLTLTLHYLPLKEILNKEMIVNDDYPVYVRYIETIKYGLENTHLLTFTFKTFKREGLGFVYPFYPLSDLAALNATHPYLSEALLFKLFFFIFTLSIPLLFYYGALIFGHNRFQAFLAGLISVIIWNFSSVMKNIFYGLFPYYWLLILWIFGISLFFNYLQNKNPKSFVASLIILLYSFLSHPFALLLSVPFIYLLAITSFKRDSALPLILKLIVVITSLILSIYLSAFVLSILNEYISGNPLMRSPWHQGRGLNELFSNIINYPFYILILIFGIFGLIFNKNRQYQLFFSLTSSLIFLLAYFGNYTPFTQFQFQRLIFALLFLMIFPSSFFFTYLYNKRNFLLYLLFFFLIVIYLLNTNYSFRERWSMKFTTSIPNHTKELIAWLAENLNSTERVLIESSGALSGHIYGGHINTHFKKWLKAEILGPSSPYYDPISSPQFELSFREAFLDKFPIANYTCQELNKLVDLFHINYFVVWSKNSTDKLRECKYPISKLIEIPFSKGPAFSSNGNNISIFKSQPIPKNFSIIHSPDYYYTKKYFITTNLSEMVLPIVMDTPFTLTSQGEIFPVKLFVKSERSVTLVGVKTNSNNFSLFLNIWT